MGCAQSVPRSPAATRVEHMGRLIIRMGKWFAGFVLIVFAALLAWAFQSRTMAELSVWHTAPLTNEFKAADATATTTLKDYLAREDALFAEVDDTVYGHAARSDTTLFSRYLAGSTQDPRQFQPNWNRTAELVPDAIRGGVLLLHGLTDSPYSLRRVAELFRAKGFYVLALRLPGHGTIPGALTNVSVADWVAASRIGARHVRARIGATLPFVVAGYSNGGGLSVKYALDALADPTLPTPDALVLFSPEIGIAPIAAISNSDKLLSFVPYFSQFRWLSIEPEYDPYKYNSFPKNAAQEAWRVTDAIDNGIKEARAAGRFARFPPTLTFLSWVDATVDTPATITRLYDRMDNDRSELVIFDVNRTESFAALMPTSEEAPLQSLEARQDLPYRLTVISNITNDSPAVASLSKAPRSADIVTTPLGLSWPTNVYSLAHVAVPFPPDDPIYGTREAATNGYAGFRLGALHPRGETRLLTVSVSQLMRLRHNPFFGYVEQRIDALIDALAQSPATAVR